MRRKYYSIISLALLLPGLALAQNGDAQNTGGGSVGGIFDGLAVGGARRKPVKSSETAASLRGRYSKADSFAVNSNANSEEKAQAAQMRKLIVPGLEVPVSRGNSLPPAQSPSQPDQFAVGNAASAAQQQDGAQQMVDTITRATGTAGFESGGIGSEKYLKSLIQTVKDKPSSTGGIAVPGKNMVTDENRF